MSRSLAAAVSIVLAASVIVRAAAQDASKPVPDDAQHLVVAGVTLADVLGRHENAAGRVTTAPYTVEHARIRVGGLDGTIVTVRAGENYREDVLLGPMHDASGRLGNDRWREDFNGNVRTIAGIHDESEARSSGVRVLLGLSEALGAFVVRIGSGEDLRYDFFDRATYRLVRSERALDDGVRITTYDEFGDVDGRIESRHLKSDDGKPFRTFEKWVDSVSASQTVDRGALAKPIPKAPLAVAAIRVRLPATIASDRIVVETTLAGRKVNFQLDSGASTVLLDSRIADALTLKQYGHSTEKVAGTFVARNALVPKLDIGAISLENLFVETGPADFSFDAAKPVAGLLGSDFLTASVFAIDYAAGTVDAIDSARFTPPDNAIVLPIRLDDGVPTIACAIGGARSAAFIVDTGADRSMLFTHFVDAHPHETADRGLGAAHQASSPFKEHIAGVGGTVTVRSVEVADFRIGSIEFARWPFLAVDGRHRSFESDDYDGLIGQDVLRYFTVYLDYPHARIALVPNARYDARFR